VVWVEVRVIYLPGKMTQMYAFVGFIFIMMSATPAAIAQENLAISGKPPNANLQSILGLGWNIYLDGEFDIGADERFAAFLAKNDPPYTSTVIFNSAGGNPITAMKIGRLIRKRGYSVDVGKRQTGSDTTRSYGNGICFSACSLAYLGGRFRWLSSSSRYGVHRFWFDKPIENSVDITQIISVAISTYVHEMGISPSFNEAFVSAGKTEITEPSRKNLAAMRVVNDGFEPAKWTIESADGVNYLKGERDTVHGINKFILYCLSPRNVMLHMIMDPQGRQDEVMGMKTSSLIINEKNFALTSVNRNIKNGWFNGTYRISATQAKAIGEAKTVGVVLQHSKDSPTFLGFDSMEIGDGQSKVQSFLQSCQI
jgi:hypothetical protein